MTRLAVALAGLVIAGVLVAEVAMGPPAGELLRLLAVFAGTAVAAAGVGAVVLTRTRTSRSLSATLTTLTVGAVLVPAAVAAVSAVTMFLEPHDLQLVLLAIALGSAMGVVLAGVALTPLRRDLGSLTDTTARLAAGDLSARTGVEREDELATLAGAIDDLARQLEEAEARRGRDDASRQALLTGVSHDLRTPLTSARVAIEAVRDGLAADVPRYLSSAARDLELAGRLVDDLFVLARTTGGDLPLERMTIDLVEVADGVVEEVRPLLAERDLKVVVRPAEPVLAEADAHALGRVIRNLVVNAIGHAPPGSRVTIDVSADDHRVEVTVLDEGPGFAPALAAAVGRHPVERDGGSGFGLAVAGGLVRAHGGELLVTPGPGGHIGFRVPVGDGR